MHVLRSGLVAHACLCAYLSLYPLGIEADDFSMSSITAIVPTYNRAAFLKETLQALQKQTRPVDEIIVWDDGSTDGTAEVAHAFGTSIRYFRGENGASHAR